MLLSKKFLPYFVDIDIDDVDIEDRFDYLNFNDHTSKDLYAIYDKLSGFLSFNSFSTEAEAVRDFLIKAKSCDDFLAKDLRLVYLGNLLDIISDSSTYEDCDILGGLYNV